MLYRGMNLAKIFRSQGAFGSNVTWRKWSCGATPANSRASSTEEMGTIKLSAKEQGIVELSLLFFAVGKSQ
jgi:hypothetical protein